MVPRVSGSPAISIARSTSLPNSEKSDGDNLSRGAISGLPRDMGASADNSDGIYSSVKECKAAVTELSKLANSATSFREKCSNVLGAAIAASLALQSASLSPRAGDTALNQIAVRIHEQIFLAISLAKKYGHRSALEKAAQLLWQAEKREVVDCRFSEAIASLNALSHSAWEWADPSNPLKAYVGGASDNAYGRAFTRHTLRPAARTPAQALVYLPNDRNPSNPSIAWATTKHFRLHSIFSQVTTESKMYSLISCLAYDRRGFIWSGHADGSAGLWSIDTAAPLVECFQLFDCSIQSIACSSQGTAWVGSVLGDVCVVQHITGQCHLLQIARHLSWIGGGGFSEAQTPTSDSTNSSLQSRLLAGGSPYQTMERRSFGLSFLTSCLNIKGLSKMHNQGSAHNGAVSCILVSAEFCWTASGFSKTSSQVLTWDTRTMECVADLARLSSYAKSPCQAMSIVEWSSIRKGLKDGPPWHLLTGHDSGNVLMWCFSTAASSSFQPVIRFGGSSSPVRGIVVCEQLGVVCVGHQNGQVRLRKLDPNTRVSSKPDGILSVWRAPFAILHTHRLGLEHMVGGASTIVTAGASGSVKVWPEASLRCAASDAGIVLKSGRTRISQAVAEVLALPSSYSGTWRTQSASSSLEGTQEPERASALSNMRLSTPLGSSTDVRTSAAQTEDEALPSVVSDGPSPSAKWQLLQRWESKIRIFKDCPWVTYDELEKERNIGEGAFSSVELAKWNEMWVAVKKFKSSDPQKQAEGSWDEEKLRLLKEEVSILARLRHPHMLLLLGVCLKPACVITEYCPNGSLYDTLGRARLEPRYASMLTWPRRIQMALDAALGMVYLHNHNPVILHRDLKSPNLFVDNGWRVKVGDFNLSRMLTPAYQACSSLEVNPRWNAPEVILGNNFTKAGDVFSFGVVMWELLTWQRPWEAEGLNSFQIMNSIKQGERPILPLEGTALPGKPRGGVQQYTALLQRCWSQEVAERPMFDVIVQELKKVLAAARASSGNGAGSQTRLAAAASPDVADLLGDPVLAAGLVGQAGPQAIQNASPFENHAVAELTLLDSIPSIVTVAASTAAPPVAPSAPSPPLPTPCNAGQPRISATSPFAQLQNYTLTISQAPSFARSANPGVTASPFAQVAAPCDGTWAAEAGVPPTTSGRLVDEPPIPGQPAPAGGVQPLQQLPGGLDSRVATTGRLLSPCGAVGTSTAADVQRAVTDMSASIASTSRPSASAADSSGGSGSSSRGYHVSGARCVPIVLQAGVSQASMTSLSASSMMVLGQSQQPQARQADEGDGESQSGGLPCPPPSSMQPSVSPFALAPAFSFESAL